MRFAKVGLDITILVSVLFLLVNAFFFLAETDFLAYLHFSRSPFFCMSFAAISFFLALMLGYFFMALHKKNMLSVRFRVKSVDIDTTIIKTYVQKSFQLLDITVDRLDVEVDRSQRLSIHTSMKKLPNMEILEQIEKEIGGMLGAKLGYLKDFEMYFSQKT
jgi:hypothetical protein